MTALAFATQIRTEYQIEHGIIRNPGKFEGEAEYMPFFYDVYLNGCADDNGHVLSVLVEPADKIAWPQLKRRQRVRFVITDQGFVTEVR